MRAGEPADEQDAAGWDLGAALGCLQQLTALTVHNVTSRQLYNEPPPAQLASLRHLRRLHFAIYGSEPAAGDLPCGPWQSSLRELALEEPLLQESLAFLQGAAELERLDIKWVRVPGGLVRRACAELMRSLPLCPACPALP